MVSWLNRVKKLYKVVFVLLSENMGRGRGRGAAGGEGGGHAHGAAGTVAPAIFRSYVVVEPYFIRRTTVIVRRIDT